MRLRWSLGPILAALSLSSAAAAEEPDSEARRLVESVRTLPSAKLARPILKEAVKRWPGIELLSTELASAYLAEKNDFWALKVLREYEEAHPPACGARALAVMIHMRQANLDLAEEKLGRDGCHGTPQDRAREHLLRASLARLRGDRSAIEQEVMRARGEATLYEEDLARLRKMEEDTFPGRMPWGSWRVDLGLGWTSNGLAGSPVDLVSRPGKTGSALLSLDSRFRLVWPESGGIRPSAEVFFRTVQLAADSSRDLSYIAPGLRPGLLIGSGHPRLLLAYAFDAVRLAAEDRYAASPVWFAEAHRMEYELEVTESLYAFGGGGRRTFREQGRTRWEFDQGIAGGIPISRGARVLLGGSSRWNRAENDAYDSVSGTAIAQLQLSLPANMEGRLNGTFSHEEFLRSRGYFPGALTENRTDNLVRTKAGVWSPSWSGVRLGIDYEYARRFSTADAYSYTDHRTLLHVTWTTDTDRFGTSTIGTGGRTPLGHGGTAASSLSDEVRIRDLMRQDEAVKQGSSCLK